jgi:hypothetical protein
MGSDGARSDEAWLVVQLKSLVEQELRPGEQELAFVLLVVVGAEQQLVVPATRDEHTDQHVGSDAASIAAICGGEKVLFHDAS